jgi:hypothetical protein
MFAYHFFPESKRERWGLTVEPASKNGGESEILRDFAEKTLTKNGVDQILLDPETSCDLRDFAEETLTKNGTDANFTADTLSAPNLNIIFSPEKTAISVPEPSETGIFSINYDGETDHAFVNQDENNFSKCSNFFAQFSYDKFFNFNFFNLKFFYRFEQIFRNNHFNINLGERAHRFMMTLESRISRFK